MARNKKVDYNPKRDKTGTTISVSLDISTARLWNQQKRHRNMSDWLRTQLEYHFGNNLNPQQKNQLLREELVILEMQRKKKIQQAESEYFEKVSYLEQKFSSDEVSLVVQNDA